MEKLSVENYLREASLRGYPVLREQAAKPIRLNIVGWRNTQARVNRFDDFIAAYWETKGRWKRVIYPATTYPGLPSLLSPINDSGTAIVVPDYYRAVYALGEYKKYRALKQVRSLSVYRDSNGNSAFEMLPNTIETGLFGIHIHRAGIFSRFVGPSSAGCQVFQKKADFEEFIALCTWHAQDNGNKFDYTLLEFMP